MLLETSFENAEIKKDESSATIEKKNGAAVPTIKSPNELE